MTRADKIRVLKNLQAGKADIKDLRPIGFVVWNSIVNEPGMYTLQNPDGSYKGIVPYDKTKEYSMAKGYHPDCIHFIPDNRSSPHLWDTAVEKSLIAK